MSAGDAGLVLVVVGAAALCGPWALIVGGVLLLALDLAAGP